VKPGVLLFIHGGVWIVGNFQNHQRLLRDLVVGSGQIGVFVEYTPLPEAKYPTQMQVKLTHGNSRTLVLQSLRLAITE
jgi:acetyl esterase/lipase